ncbi:hypothetical protein SAMN05216593_116125 [Pseudomonas asturiensis]|uniref:Uncharacterized protein n=1 Tax=Pseudomonas asturiensis TaxID=1190415 RepID=A0A1M7Q217_9PSED|nr:hypothetical protein [Pseudomonas asturiensis]SHN24137.1 hypothetical protein SAMN05216593_116125 [Pseudomonas asturiensis]
MDQPHKWLAKQAGLWRVDGIGPIEEDARLGARVTVYFSGLVEDGLNKPYVAASSNGVSLKIKAHASWLYEFKVGSLWKNGLLAAQPGEMEKRVVIDVDQTRYFPLTHSIPLNGQWANDLLPNYHMGENRRSLASSSFAVIPVLNDPRTKWLVVPASEIFRFYNGASARLLSSSLQGGIQDFIDWDKCDLEGRVPILYVKKDINKQEAAVLARAYISKRARAALHYPHNQLSSTKLNNAAASNSSKSPLVLKAIFPFDGTTQLGVAGKRMLLSNKGNDPQWAIFAMEINHCSKAKEFTRLVVVRDNTPSVTGRTVDISGNAPTSFRAQIDGGEEEDDFFTDLPADQRLGRRVSLCNTNQFSAFEGLEFEYRSPPAEKVDRGSSICVDVPVNSLTFEDGSYSKDAQGNLGVSIFQSQDYLLGRELQQFMQMLAELRQQTVPLNWTIRTRKLNGSVSDDGEDLIASFPSNVGKKRTWHIITDVDGSEYPRKVIWTEILTTSHQYFYLLEMELKAGESGQCTLLLYKVDLQRMDNQFFKELLMLTAIQNRWPSADNSWSKKSYQFRAKKILDQINMCRIRHPSLTKSTVDGLELNSSFNAIDANGWANIVLAKIYSFVPGIE